MTLTRRGFLAASAALAATTAWPLLATAGEQPLSLTATTRVIEVEGRAAVVMGLTNGSGGQGLILAMAGMNHSGMAYAGMMMDGSGHAGMGGIAMDLNDIEFDAYLANDRTLADPEVIAVERGGRILLRIINAAAATSFWIDTGGIPARLVAVDGHPIEPVAGTRFGLAMGQRLDLEIRLPGAGAFPILALREGARERTGVVLATPGAPVPRIEALGDSASGAFDIDLSQESRLHAASADAATLLAPRPADRSHMIMLGGSMQPYLWTIDGRTWGNHAPITARTGERVHLTSTTCR